MIVLNWKNFSIDEWETMSVVQLELFGINRPISHPLVFNDVYIIAETVFIGSMVKSINFDSNFIKNINLDTDLVKNINMDTQIIEGIIYE